MEGQIADNVMALSIKVTSVLYTDSNNFKGIHGLVESRTAQGAEG